MTIDKAIELLQDELNYGEGSHERDLEDAIQLGIEALKGIREHRTWPMSISLKQLPGETKD